MDKFSARFVVNLWKTDASRARARLNNKSLPWPFIFTLDRWWWQRNTTVTFWRIVVYGRDYRIGVCSFRASVPRVSRVSRGLRESFARSDARDATSRSRPNEKSTRHFPDADVMPQIWMQRPQRASSRSRLKNTWSARFVRFARARAHGRVRSIVLAIGKKAQHPRAREARRAPAFVLNPAAVRECAP